jgi:hypothetical protein
MLKTHAWDKLHSPSKDDEVRNSEFEKTRQEAIEYAKTIYELLDQEAAEILGT